MWDQRVRRLTEEGFKRRPQSPLRRSRERFRNDPVCNGPARTECANYSGIGAELKAARERQGQRLADVASILHIQQRYLEAIESGRFGELPGSTYVTGFLRSYSRHLGAEPDSVIAAFREETTMPLGPTKLVVPETIAEPRRPRAAIMLISLLAAAVVYAGWSYFHDDAVEFGDGVAPAPERLVNLLHAESTSSRPMAAEAAPQADIGIPAAEGAARQPSERWQAAGGAAASMAREAQRDADSVLDTAAPAVSEPTPPTAPVPASASVVPAEAAAEPEADEDTPPETPELARIEAAPSTPPIPQPPRRESDETTALPPLAPSPGVDHRVPQRFGGGDTDARVVVRATADSWVQIQGARNETLLTRILRPGDAFYAPNRGDLVLTTGNVGGLEIIVDGEPLGPLGPMGAVRRNISLDAETLLAMTGGRERQR